MDMKKVLGPGLGLESFTSLVRYVWIICKWFKRVMCICHIFQ